MMVGRAPARVPGFYGVLALGVFMQLHRLDGGHLTVNHYATGRTHGYHVEGAPVQL